MRKIILALAGLAGIAAFAAPAAASAATAPQPVTVHLATDCVGVKPGVFGRGVRLGATVGGVPQITLSTKSNLVMKYGRFGEFTACSNYPKCKYVKQKTIGVKCP